MTAISKRTARTKHLGFGVVINAKIKNIPELEVIPIFGTSPQSAMAAARAAVRHLQSQILVESVSIVDRGPVTNS